MNSFAHYSEVLSLVFVAFVNLASSVLICLHTPGIRQEVLFEYSHKAIISHFTVRLFARAVLSALHSFPFPIALLIVLMAYILTQCI